EVDSGSDFDLSSEGEIAVPPVSAAPTAGTGKQSSVLKMAPEDMQDSAFDDSGEFSSTGSLDAPPAPSTSQVSLGTEPLPLAGTGASSAALGGMPPKDPHNPGGESDVRLTLESGSFEFDLTVDSSGRLAGASAPP